MEFESLEAIVDFAIEKEIIASEYSYNTSIKNF